jgi:putative addiction module CopG family antidote
MTITLSPELDRLVHIQLATGQYASIEDVLAAALRALDEKEQVVAAVKEGYADFQRGQYRAFDDSDAEFRRRQAISPNE